MRDVDADPGGLSRTAGGPPTGGPVRSIRSRPTDLHYGKNGNVLFGNAYTGESQRYADTTDSATIGKVAEHTSSH